MSTTGETGQTPRSAASRGTNSSDGGSGGPSVYLSYRPEDETYARRLSKDLGQRLIAGTVVSEVAGSGDRWEQQIRAALESADVLLLILGPTYLGGGSLSSSQTYEIASVLARRVRVIPVFVGGSDPPAGFPPVLGELARDQAVVLKGDRPDAAGLQKLVNAISRADMARPTPRRVQTAEPISLLPREVRGFVDRSNELERLLNFFAGAGKGPVGPPLVAQIVGSGGIGKSALALRAAHQMRGLFPDGQLYASLGEPAAEERVLSQFLEAFGFDRRDLPESLDGLAELYQSMLDGKRVLVVLDDVLPAARAEMLIPQATQCAALLISRTGWPQLDLTRPATLLVALDTGLPVPDALSLLRSNAGTFVDENPKMAEDLVRAVNGQPLALQLFAAQVRLGGTASVSGLAGLNALPDSQIRRVLLEQAYGRLSGIEQRLFRLLAVLPMPEFEPGLAAAAAGIQLEEVYTGLHSLVDSVLLEPSGEDRYRLGDLVAGFARERLAAEESEDQRRTALQRAIRWIAVQTAYQPQAPITRDYWTVDDTLGYNQYADAIAAFIRHKGTRPPLTIGIKAPWGAGKTSLMRMVQVRLDPRQDPTTWKPMPLELSDDSRDLLTPRRAAVDASTHVTNREVLRRAAEPPPDGEGADANRLSVEPPATPLLQTEQDWRPTVWFNPWMYQSGEQVWAGLAYEIITQVTDRLAPGDKERFWLALNLRRVDRQALRRRIYRLLAERFLPWLLSLAVAIVLALAGILAALVFPVIAGPLRAAAAGLVSLAGTAFGIGGLTAAGRFLHENAAGPFTSLLRTPDLVKSSRNLAAEQTRNAFDEIIRDPGYETRLGFLHLVQTDMRRVLDLIATERRPLVVFVDDLDRCSPGAVSQVIEAINLFLAGEFPNCIFILAMEPAVVAAHVEAVYKDLAKLQAEGVQGRWPTLGWRFLEKIVQLPLSLPPPDPTGLRDRYVNSLFEGGQDSGVRVHAPQKDQPEAAATSASGGSAGPVAIPAQHGIGSPDAAEASSGADHAALVQRLEAAIRSRAATAEDLSTAALAAQEEVLGIPADHLRPETSEAANRVFIELYSDAEARAAILAGVPGLASDNPREIKRFVNLFRFYSFVDQQHQLQGLPSADGAEIAKLAVLAIRWPSLLDTFGQMLENGETTTLAYLEQKAQMPANVDDDTGDTWAKALTFTGLLSTVVEGKSHQAWTDQLQQFLKTNPSIATVAKRML